MPFKATQQQQAVSDGHEEREYFAQSVVGFNSTYPFGSNDIRKDGQSCFGRSSRISNVGGPMLAVTYYSFDRQIAYGAESSTLTAVACG